MAGSLTKVRGSGPGCGIIPCPPENAWVNNEAIATTLAADLEARLPDLEALGALVAAAHLQAAIDSLRREFPSPPEASVSD